MASIFVLGVSYFVAVFGAVVCDVSDHVIYVH